MNDEPKCVILIILTDFFTFLHSTKSNIIEMRICSFQYRLFLFVVILFMSIMLIFGELFYTTVWSVLSVYGTFRVCTARNLQRHHSRTNGYHVPYDSSFCNISCKRRPYIRPTSYVLLWSHTITVRFLSLRYVPLYCIHTLLLSS